MSDNKAFISMRYHTVARINRADFAALKKFEHDHRALYVGARAPKKQDMFRDMAAQMEAFNRVFESAHKEQFVEMIEECKR